MELKATRYDIDGHVATVWLHRPHRHNAWTGRMHAEYRWVMAQLEADALVRVVVVTGTPPAFCVGADSQALAGHVERGGYDDGLPAEVANPGYGTQPDFDHDFVWHYGLRFPVIAAVNGACAGVGLALALYCDLRFVAAGARLTTAAPRLGLPAEFGMSWVLPRLVGVTRAADLLLSGAHRHRRRNFIVGTLEWRVRERRRHPRRSHPVCPNDGGSRVTRRDARHQTPALPGLGSPRRRRVGRPLPSPAQRDDGRCGVRRRGLRFTGEATTGVLATSYRVRRYADLVNPPAF